MIRQRSIEGVVFYSSSLLQCAGVPHAFSTRIGGLSAGPFDSLNLGNPNGCAIQDDYDLIWKNYGMLQRSCGLGGRRLVRVHQVHDAGVAVAAMGCDLSPDTQADAIATIDPSATLSVRVADCAPVLIASVDGLAVAAVHAGWRGAVAGVLSAAMGRMREIHRLATPDRLLVAFGPCIGFEAFEVGAEVAERFLERGQSLVRSTANGKFVVDLRGFLVAEAMAQGVPADCIDVSDRCTVRDVEEFYSHRRENGITGRMAALIGTRLPACNG